MSEETSMIWGAEASYDDRLWALLAHLLAFVVPVFGSLVVYLIKKDQSRFVAYHAMQAVVWQLAVYIVSGFTCGIGLIGLVGSIWLAMQANKGVWEGYPLLSSVGRGS